jgi:small-conductance mechanosensitive channel
MKTTETIAAVALLGLLGATAYGLLHTGGSAAPSGSSAPGARPQAQSMVDQTPLLKAQELAKLADSAEEQAIAAEAIRLADHESDLAFAAAEHELKTHPPELSAKAKEVEARLDKAQELQTSQQALVAQLTAEEAKASGNKKIAVEDKLEAAQAELELTQDEVDDASQELVHAGGDAKWWLEQLAQQHQAASESVDKAPRATVTATPEQFGLIHRFQQWSALQQKKKLLQDAKTEAETAAAALRAKHDALDARIEAAKQASPDLARHAKKKIETGGAAPQTERSHEESVAALAGMKQIISDQQDLVGFARRSDYQKQLAANYEQWIVEVAGRQKAIAHRALQGTIIILLIAVVGLFFGTWMDRILSRLSMDRRQIQTLHTVTRVSLQIIAVLLILLVIFGPPSQLGTFLGLAGAGLTVALKDFIVGFLGWFVLMGKNGIRLGDWVEINGVTGEVVELGMFHTVLLETGNWTDSGHPTGRRVTFTNGFAIENHYFNFSTSGQWLWDELQVVLPAGQDPYLMVAAISEKVKENTTTGAEEAEAEWKRAAGARNMTAMTAAPAINVKPVVGGVEISVRYITRASERYQLRAKLYQAAVDLLGKPPLPAEASRTSDPAKTPQSV